MVDMNTDGVNWNKIKGVEFMRIETKEINNKKIIAEVDTEENSIDIAIVIDGADIPITFNVSILNNEAVRLRKWYGYDVDGEDETVYINDVE